MATQYLLDRGFTRIAHIAGPANMQASVDRTDGFHLAMKDAGVSADLVAYGDFTLMSGARAMAELLDGGAEFDAIFVASDLMANGAISVLRERGIRVPDQIAVVGFDDSSAATTGSVPLTTVHQPSREMGTEMASMLLDLLQGRKTDVQRILPTRMVIRESA